MKIIYMKYYDFYLNKLSYYYYTNKIILKYDHNS